MSTKEIPAADLRDMWNEHIQPQLDNRKYTLVEIRRGTPNPAANQPPGTASVMYKVLNETGLTIARAHSYELPGGARGASGRLDPKQIRRRGVIYVPKV